MTRSRLNATQRKVKNLLLSGRSVPAIARSMKVGQSTVYNTVNQLLALGEIRHVPGIRLAVLDDSVTVGYRRDVVLQQVTPLILVVATKCRGDSATSDHRVTMHAPYG